VSGASQPPLSRAGLFLCGVRGVSQLPLSRASLFLCKTFNFFFYVFNESYYFVFSHERLKSSTKFKDEASPLIRFRIFMFCSYNPAS
jgi:hypothetical protein